MDGLLTAWIGLRLREYLKLCVVIAVIVLDIATADPMNPNSLSYIDSSSIGTTNVFDYSSSVKGDISYVEVTPAGRKISPYHSHISNINQDNLKLYERTSALQGKYSSTDHSHFEFTTIDLANVTIVYSPFVLNVKETLRISSWNAKRNIEYSGKEINDRDYAFNDFDQYGGDTNTALFFYNTNFSKDRIFTSPGTYSVDAKTTGITELKFNHSLKNEPLIVDELYYGKFNLSMKDEHEFGSVSSVGGITCEDWLGGICEVPCWDRDELEKIIVVGPGSVYTIEGSYYIKS